MGHRNFIENASKIFLISTINDQCNRAHQSEHRAASPDLYHCSTGSAQCADPTEVDRVYRRVGQNKDEFYHAHVQCAHTVLI